MSPSYLAGLSKVFNAAREQHHCIRNNPQTVPLQDAIGSIAAHDITSPRSTPEYETSAIGGYAIRSQATNTASQYSPVKFRIRGTIEAGDDPSHVLEGVEDLDQMDCVEIMAGAIFPGGFDALVKAEDVVVVDVEKGHNRHIVLTRSIETAAYRSVAGSDIREGDCIVQRGETIQPTHILPLVSLEFKSVPVVRKPRICICSTKKEITNGNGATRDANGPYFTAAVQELGLPAKFLGVLDDSPARLKHVVERAVNSGEYDVFLTTGGVSNGKFDHVREVLEGLEAEVLFHGLTIQPGHPVLFAQIPTERGKVAFFGLPGNPGAAAACFRFLTMPYLRRIQGQTREQPVMARLIRNSEVFKGKHGCKSIQGTDCFQHGVLSNSTIGQLTVQPSEEQSPAKISPFTTANCWIHFRHGHQQPLPGPSGSEIVECYPISPTGTIQLSTSFIN